ncbi:MAG: hypothetical protein M1598_08910, partial [Actinobacteria bacterium]|nr:hypothetical protein [Actinomycetota bacterium]
MKRTLRIVGLVALIALLATACSPKPASNPPGGAPPASGRGSGSGTGTPSTPPGTGAQTGSQTGGTQGESKPIDLAKVKPNELGEIIILEYHGIANKEERWARQYENFRKDLETLYNQGYRLLAQTGVQPTRRRSTGFRPRLGFRHRHPLD